MTSEADAGDDVDLTFAVGKFEVTFAEWDACVVAGGCKYKPGDQGWGRNKRPVVNVSWDDISKEYLPWLSRKTGKTYRLLTEAEWEYACRAGTKTRFWCGGGDASLQGNANIADAALKAKCPGASWAVAWADGYAFTSPVGSFKANRWGLYDMGGNVNQWCADGYGPYGEDGVNDQNRKQSASARVIRGGSWKHEPRDCRSAFRTFDPSSSPFSQGR